MEVASLVVAIIACILTIPGFIAYFEAKSKEKEEFKHALGNTENRQLFNEFVSRADGSIKLFKSTLAAISYCNEHLNPPGQYFTDKEKELSEHPKWFEKTTKAFIIRDRFYKKSYQKIIRNAIAKEDNDCKDLCNQMVENAKKNPGRIPIIVDKCLRRDGCYEYHKGNCQGCVIWKYLYDSDALIDYCNKHGKDIELFKMKMHYLLEEDTR